MKIIKNITDIEKLYTFFEFLEHSDWDDFDFILSNLTDRMNCSVLEKLDGIWSRHCVLDKDGFVFKLLYHEDFGNCLCNQKKKSESYYSKLEGIANELAIFLSNEGEKHTHQLIVQIWGK